MRTSDYFAPGHAWSGEFGVFGVGTCVNPSLFVPRSFFSTHLFPSRFVANDEILVRWEHWRNSGHATALYLVLLFRVKSGVPPLTVARAGLLWGLLYGSVFVRVERTPPPTLRYEAYRLSWLFGDKKNSHKMLLVISMYRVTTKGLTQEMERFFPVWAVINCLSG